MSGYEKVLDRPWIYASFVTASKGDAAARSDPVVLLTASRASPMSSSLLERSFAARGRGQSLSPRVLASPCFAADVGDPISEFCVALDDVDLDRVELFLSDQRANDCVETLVVARLRELLHPARKSRLVPIGHRSFLSMRIAVEHSVAKCFRLVNAAVGSEAFNRTTSTQEKGRVKAATHFNPSPRSPRHFPETCRSITPLQSKAANTYRAVHAIAVASAHTAVRRAAMLCPGAARGADQSVRATRRDLLGPETHRSSSWPLRVAPKDRGHRRDSRRAGGPGLPILQQLLAKAARAFEGDAKDSSCPCATHEGIRVRDYHALLADSCVPERTPS